MYPPQTRAALVEMAISPVSWFPASLEEWESGHWEGQKASIIAEGSFLIGNHSDELTVNQRCEFPSLLTTSQAMASSVIAAPGKPSSTPISSLLYAHA